MGEVRGLFFPATRIFIAIELFFLSMIHNYLATLVYFYAVLLYPRLIHCSCFSFSFSYRSPPRGEEDPDSDRPPGRGRPAALPDDRVAGANHQLDQGQGRNQHLRVGQVRGNAGDATRALSRIYLGEKSCVCWKGLSVHISRIFKVIVMR